MTVVCSEKLCLQKKSAASTVLLQSNTDSGGSLFQSKKSAASYYGAEQSWVQTSLLLKSEIYTTHYKPSYRHPYTAIHADIYTEFQANIQTYTGIPVHNNPAFLRNLHRIPRSPTFLLSSIHSKTADIHMNSKLSYKHLSTIVLLDWAINTAFQVFLQTSTIHSNPAILQIFAPHSKLTNKYRYTIILLYCGIYS